MNGLWRILQAELQITAATFLLASLTACTAATPVCATSREWVPAGQTTIIDRLYFGRSIESDATTGPHEVSDAEWNEFADTVLSHKLPAGFTWWHATGQWLDPARGERVHERAIVVESIRTHDADWDSVLQGIIDEYKSSFTSSPSCGFDQTL